MSKVYDSVVVVFDGVLFDGMVIVVGGFGLCGIFEFLIQVICDVGIKDLIIYFNNVGVDDFGFGLLLQIKQIKKMCLFYVGENDLFMQ